MSSSPGGSFSPQRPPRDQELNRLGRNNDSRMQRAQSFAARGEESGPSPGGGEDEDRGWHSFRGQRRGGSFRVLDVPASSSLLRSPDASQGTSTLDFLQNIRVRRNDTSSDDATPYPSSPLVQRSPRPALKRLNSKSQVTQLQEHALPALSLGTYRRAKPKGETCKRVSVTTRCGQPALPTRLYEAVSSGASRSAIEMLVKSDHSQISQQNAGGLTPLHCAIERYDTSIDTIMLLLESDPKAAGIRCQRGQTPIDLIWKRFVDPDSYRSEETLERAAGLRRLLQDAVGSIESQRLTIRSDATKPPVSEVLRRRQIKKMLRDNPSLRQFWQLVTVFIHAACHGRARSMHKQSGRGTLIVHDAVMQRCDPLLVRFALARYPEEGSRRDNSLQRLPLHIAASDGPSSEKLLNTLLAIDPRAASVSDATGRLPIHSAIVSGLTWEGGMMSLIQAFPISILIPDPLTHLLPFQLAAESKSVGDINTIYNLLEWRPTESVRGGIDD